MIKNILTQLKKDCTQEIDLQSSPKSDNRRSFLKKSAFGGISLAGIMGWSTSANVEKATSKISRFGAPSDLRITDMRYTTVANGTGATNARNVIIRIDTNQGIYGLGEVRDGGDYRYALFLKSRLLGKNPINVEMLFKIIKPFGGHGRMGGGVSGVEMALWDLAGKAFNSPVWAMLGGMYRDKIRLYTYIPNSGGKPLSQIDHTEFKADIHHRIAEQGYTWLKMHPGLEKIFDIPGAITGMNQVDSFKDRVNPQQNYLSYQNTRHDFSPIQVTQKGIEELVKYSEYIRSVVGYDIPLSIDHLGHYDLNNCIKVCKALERFNFASVEDLLPWTDMKKFKQITENITIPTMTGEDIYLKEEFKKLVDNQIVDMVHPDMGTSGGILETKRIGDYAEEGNTAMMLHFAGTPVSFMANVHCAAATQNVLALEMPNQVSDNAWWPTLVKMVGKQPLYSKGYAHVPVDAPGLGIELNDEVMKQHLHAEDKSYFEPTPQWNAIRSHDRLWS